MAAVVGKYAANKLLKKQMGKYANKKVDGGEDPLFAMVEDPKKPGKMKKVKKQIPAYIPEGDAMVLAKARTSAYRLDCGLFTLFGIRFGWESVIGLIPAVGDAFGLIFALLVFKRCRSVEGGLPTGTQVQMLINIVIDFVVGLIPFVGDVVDAAFKCNTKNVRLLEQHLDKKYRPDGLKDARDYAGVDKEDRKKRRKSGLFTRRDPPPATAFEDFDDEAEDRRRFMREQDSEDGYSVREPERARAPEDRRGGGRQDFSGGRQGSRREAERERRY